MKCVVAYGLQAPAVATLAAVAALDATAMDAAAAEAQVATAEVEQVGSIISLIHLKGISKQFSKIVYNASRL